MTIDAEQFRKSLRESLKKNRESFEGEYKEELDSLLGLSREEIDQITPDTTDLEIYDQLITVIREASRSNVNQAELKTQIENLGDIAIRIAQKIPKLAGMFL